jgi:hypothetical protein
VAEQLVGAVDQVDDHLFISNTCGE